MIKKKNKKIGILGGTFDPAHIGHIKISKKAKEIFGLYKVIWAITKKNPFKNRSKANLKDRIDYAKKINIKNNFIKVYCFENTIKSERTIDLIKHLKKKYKNKELYFIIGADNLINFHKWKKWKQIVSNCNILVFNRNKYKSKSLKSLAFKTFNNKGLKFINFKKVNISSSQLRKI